MSEFWRQRTARERTVLALGAGALGALAFLQFVVVPTFALRGDMREQAKAAEADYALVAKAATLGATGPASATPVREALNAAAGEVELQLSYVNTLPGGAVELQAGPVDPEAAFRLFAELQAEHGIKVVSADIARIEGDDGVRVQAVLSR